MANNAITWGRIIDLGSPFYICGINTFTYRNSIQPADGVMARHGILIVQYEIRKDQLKILGLRSRPCVKL